MRKRKNYYKRQSHKRQLCSYEVKVGDLIEVIFGSRLTKVKVLDVRDVVRKEDVGELYELIKVKKVEGIGYES